MQRGQGLPSLPPNSQLYNGPGHRPQQPRGAQYHPTNVGALAAHALTSTLTNPYGHGSYSYTNPNYHAYFTQTHNSGTTSQGYTLSSTYSPSATSSQSESSWTVAQRGRSPSLRRVNHHPSYPSSQLHNNGFSGPGDTRCTHAGCAYTGTKKTVEIHMMDRHLIFPPDWKKRKSDWDADPSLKGKPVPIPGTGLMLNTPEAIDAWISERKNKWPTDKRVEDKKRKLQEAADRGEINPNELTARSHKRRKIDPKGDGRSMGRGRTRGRGNGRGNWEIKTSDSGWRGRNRGGGASNRFQSDSTNFGTDYCEKEMTVSETSLDKDSSDSSSDMDPVKDAVSSKTPNLEPEPRILTEELDSVGSQIVNDDDTHIDEHFASRRSQLDQGVRPARRQRPAQPRIPPSNPFASRPSLLRNLLLPEIRHTISNLSQAIHFLVENDFLEGVELKPGDSDSQRIRVLESPTVEDDYFDFDTGAAPAYGQ